MQGRTILKVADAGERAVFDALRERLEAASRVYAEAIKQRAPSPESRYDMAAGYWWIPNEENVVADTGKST